MPMPILFDLIDAKHQYDDEKVKAAQKRSDEIAKVKAREEERQRQRMKTESRKSTSRRK